MNDSPVTLKREDDGRWIASVDTDAVSASIYGDTEVLALMKLVQLVCEIYEESMWDACAAQERI